MSEVLDRPDGEARVFFDAQPARYRHWRLSFDGATATLALSVAEDGGLRPGYKLKLNSYDLGVDIELADALDRIRFEHPEVRCVVITGGRERLFCSGANIYMLGLSSHAWKVNFCKFTNETRNGMEDSSAHDGLKFLAAVNGACAGGGYELALACDEILLVDDRSSSVSLPEVPLLGVLPGTGGLTRLTDKRKLRRDLADVFCTTTEGVRGQRAMDWGLVDALAKPADFERVVRERASALAASVSEGAPVTGAKGIALTPLRRTIEADAYRYETIDVEIDRAARLANIVVRAPQSPPPRDAAAAQALGADWYPLKLARELDDAILMLRTNELEVGTWIIRTRGDATLAIAHDEFLDRQQQHWFVRRAIGWLRRALNRLEVSARSLFALVEPGSCFAGTLFELALAADRVYMLDAENGGPTLVLSDGNFGLYRTLRGSHRLAERFAADERRVERLHQLRGTPVSAARALDLGLVTSTPDEIDWADEVRIAIEERVSLSPDALTGLEQNLRFGGEESMATRIFGRLSAWQNWIFVRPNAVGEQGALKVFGTGSKARFDWKRT